MKRCWVARTYWTYGGETMCVLDTRQEARNYKRNMLASGNVIKKITIHKAQDFKSGRFYISGKVHY